MHINNMAYTVQKKEKSNGIIKIPSPKDTFLLTNKIQLDKCKTEHRSGLFTLLTLESKLLISQVCGHKQQKPHKLNYSSQD